MGKQTKFTDEDRCMYALVEARAIAEHMVNRHPAYNFSAERLIAQMKAVIEELVSDKTNTALQKFPELVLTLQVGLALFEGQRQAPDHYGPPAARVALNVAWLKFLDELAVLVVNATRFANVNDYSKAEQHWRCWVGVTEIMVRS